MSLYDESFPRLEYSGLRGPSAGGVRVLRLGWWPWSPHDVKRRPWRPRLWSDWDYGITAYSLYVPLLGTFSWYAPNDDVPGTP